MPLEPFPEPRRPSDFHADADVHADDGKVGDHLDEHELGPEDVILRIIPVSTQSGRLGVRKRSSH